MLETISSLVADGEKVALKPISFSFGASLGGNIPPIRNTVCAFIPAFSATCTNQRGETVVEGEWSVRLYEAPS